MSSTDSLRSALGAVIERYLALRQALGRDCYAERRIFIGLDRFLADHPAAGADLTGDTFEQWCLTDAHLRSGVRRARMRVVRNLCLYRRRTEPGCFVPDIALFPAEHQRVRPHIFTEVEIRALLDAALALPPSPRSPLRPNTFHLALVLLYTSGLRRSEAVRVTVGDYDATERTLLIRASKFHRSRLLPLSADTAAAVDAYLEARRVQRISLAATSPLLWHLAVPQHGYSGPGLGQGIRALMQQCEIRSLDGHTPRVHDLRHTFAVHALVRWYRAGVDVQAKLPYLATYMGHVSIVSTAYYLHFVQALADQANERFASRYGTLLTAVSAPGGHP